MATRKPVGFSEDGGSNQYVVLCDDGTVWNLGRSGKKWTWNQIDAKLPGSLSDGGKPAVDRNKQKEINRRVSLSFQNLGDHVSDLKEIEPVSWYVYGVTSALLGHEQFQSIFFADPDKMIDSLSRSLENIRKGVVLDGVPEAARIGAIKTTELLILSWEQTREMLSGN